MIASDISQLIGNTPLLRLRKLSDGKHNVFAKCEFLNPGGSTKDRPAAAMVEMAASKGYLKPGGTIVEATAGNTGMGLAIAAARGGYKLIAVMTDKMSVEKVNILKAFGATVEICPYGVAPEDPRHFINRAIEIANSTEGGWYADQFNNFANLEAHYRGTGPELWRQCEGNIDAVIAGVGTGGTLLGITKYLKQKRSSIKVIMADPIGSILSSAVRHEIHDPKPYLVEGIGGDFLPALVDFSFIDHAIQVTDQDAIQSAHDIFRSEGIFVGASSGCILAAAKRYIEESAGPESENVAVILPDGGRSYISSIYSTEWCSRNGIYLS